MNSQQLSAISFFASLALSGCGGGDFDPSSVVAVEPIHAVATKNHSIAPASSNDHSRLATPFEQSAEIATSFYRTKLDHYPLDASLTRPLKPEEPVRPVEPDWPVRPEKPERPEFDQEAYLVWGQLYLDEYQQFLAAEEAAYEYALAEHELLLRHLEQSYAAELAAYEEYLEHYEDVLAFHKIQLNHYEAGECCWEMFERESEVASRDEVLAMLRENIFELQFDNDDGRMASSSIRGHRSPPVVRFDREFPLEARAAALRAIDNINAWLPWEKHLTVENDADLQSLEVAVEEAYELYASKESDYNVWYVALRAYDLWGPGHVVDAANDHVQQVIEHEKLNAELNGEEFSLSQPAIVAARNAAAEVAALHDANRNSQASLLEALEAALDRAELQLQSHGDAVNLANDALYPDNVINAVFGRGVPRGCGNGWSNGINIAEGCGSTVVIQHELLHALGLTGGRSCYEKFGSDCDINSFEGPMYYYSHVGVSKFPESEMAYASPYDDTHGLSQIDGETLQTIYTREHLWEHPSQENAEFLAEMAREHALALGVSEEEADAAAEAAREAELEHYSHMFDVSDFSSESLGEWDDAVVRYEGRFGRDIRPNYYYNVVQPSFGIDWRNGIGRPWANGDVTQGTFADSGLIGSATWNGGLVGFTPRQEAVHGESAIQVNLAELDGWAAFTALEYWSSGTAPGSAGTGMQWGDGDLQYLISLDGNYLRSTAGDEGYVSGRFVGEYHEGAVGILEHTDLAAGWGALR